MMTKNKQKAITVLLVFAAILTFTSCTKTKNELFKGYYSFKTSGILTIEKEVCDLDGNRISIEEIEVNLTPENGQMNILSVDDKTGAMIVTMNIVGGDMLKYDATADKNTLTIENQRRNIKLEDVELTSMMALVSGTGKKYDNNVVFDFKYEGSSVKTTALTETTFTIIDSEVNCVAKSND